MPVELLRTPRIGTFSGAAQRLVTGPIAIVFHG